MRRVTLVALKHDQRGQILLITLVLLLIGSIIIPALLTNTASGVKTNRVYEDKSNLLYAADAGIEDGKWHVKYSHLSLIPGYEPFIYYDDTSEATRAATSFSYPLPETANNQSDNVTIANIWVPGSEVDISGYTTEERSNIVEVGNTTGESSAGILMVKGSVTGDISTSVPSTANYQIKINYDPVDDLAANPLYVSTIGIWIPSGFSYVAGSCNLETGDSYTYHLSDATAVDRPGGHTVVWEYAAYPFAGDSVGIPNQDPLPGVVPSDDNVMECDITFKITRDATTSASTYLNAVSWITTDGSISELPFAWDNDTKYYYIKSTSDTTSVETYIAKSELREMQSAITGDYYATGQSLIQDTAKDSTSSDNPKYRERLLTSSSSDVTTIPADAQIDAAYLYWSGWVQNYGNGMFWDQCDKDYLTDKWTVSSGSWLSDNAGTARSYTDKYKSSGTSASLTKKDSIDLSGTASATIKWDQTVTGTATSSYSRCLPSGDGDKSGTWSASTPSLFWDDVDEDDTSVSDSDYITGTGSSGGYTLFTGTGFSSISLPSGSAIHDLTIYYRAKDDTNGTNNIRAVIKVDGTIYSTTDSGSNPSNSSYTTYSYAFATNPQTGLAWTLDDIKGTGTHPLQQFGVASNDLSPAVRVSMVYAQVNFTNEYLKLAISKNGGTSFTDLGNYPVTSSLSYTLTDTALPGYVGSGANDIKIKFSLNFTSGSSKYVELDNIVITDDSLPYHYDPNITFNINDSVPSDDQSLEASSIYPEIMWADFDYSARSGTATFTNGSATVTGSSTNFTSNVVAGNKVMLNGGDVWYTVSSVDSSTSITLTEPYAGDTASGNYCVFDGYYYGCKKDVTDLVKSYSNGTDLSDESNPIYGNGNGTYTVGDAYSDTQSVQHPGKLADAGFGGWSLVIIYSSAETAGHQLYLFDRFRSVPNADGSNPYVISEAVGGFIVPDKIAGETSTDDVARLSIFVGEGDAHLSPDYVAFVPQSSTTEYKLWDGVSCTNNSSTSPDNVWNSRFIDQSTGTESGVAGIDCDTFHITWGDGWLNTGDTSATINMSTNGDGWVLYYMILSFRSDAVTGGSINYLITQ